MINNSSKAYLKFEIVTLKNLVRYDPLTTLLSPSANFFGGGDNPAGAMIINTLIASNRIECGSREQVLVADSLTSGFAVRVTEVAYRHASPLAALVRVVCWCVGKMI